MKKIIRVETPCNKHGQSNKVYKRTLAASRAEQIFSEHVILRRLARISRDGVVEAEWEVEMVAVDMKDVKIEEMQEEEELEVKEAGQKY